MLKSSKIDEHFKIFVFRKSSSEFENISICSNAFYYLKKCRHGPRIALVSVYVNREYLVLVLLSSSIVWAETVYYDP